MDKTANRGKLKKSYNIGRGNVTNVTNYRVDYNPKNGGPSLPLRVPDNLRQGDLQLKDTTYRKHYKNTKGDPFVSRTKSVDKML